MRSSSAIRIIAALLLAAAALTPAGCSWGWRAGQVQPASSSTVATQAATPASDAAAGAAAAAGGTSGGAAASKKGSGKGLSATDAKELDAQLSAIQSELDKMSVPSESDFNGIGSGLQ